MGMFDTIKCKYKLPLPENAGELNESHLIDFQGQTKDLDCAMDYFEITESGDLIVERFEGEWVKGDPKAKGLHNRIGFFNRTKTWLEPHLYNGDISFYDSIQIESLNNDYWIQYKATFSNGKLLQIKLDEFEISDNSERKSVAKIWAKLGVLNENFRKTLFYRLFYKYYLLFWRIIGKGVYNVAQLLCKFWYLERCLDFMGLYFEKKSGAADMRKEAKKKYLNEQ